MKRRDLLYGYFTSMYGIAGVVITMVVEYLGENKIGSIFFSSVIISGIIEYMTSLILEKWFGLKFWDYTRIKPNLHGRVNLWYLILFGICGVCWSKVYVNLVDVVKFNYGRGFIVGSLVVMVFFICNFIITGMLFYRYKKRREGILPQSHFDKWLDLKYNDNKIRSIFPAIELSSEINIE